MTEFKVGQRVGVGAQVGSCGSCKACKNDNGAFETIAPLGSRARLTSRELLRLARSRLQHPVSAAPILPNGDRLTSRAR